MNARIQSTIPSLGERVHGGFFHGVLLIGGELWGEVTAAKSAGDLTGIAWHPKYTDIAGARSDFDGLANAIAMAEAGSPLAQALRELRHEGFDDWYLPARAGQLMQWGNLQPLLPDEEKLETAWYWSSTQFSRDYAYLQDFGLGGTDDSYKSWEGGRARAVRRFRLE
jgi:hypothetical protein